MTKPNKLKSIQIGYGDDQVIFHPRMVHVAEEEEVNARINDISDTDEAKFDKTFEICKEALAEFSSEMPQKLIREKGELKRVPLIEGAETPQEAIDKYFAERTAENERIVRDAFWLLKKQMSPDSRFL